MTPDAAITGIGLVTPAGGTRESTWDTVCAGRPTAAPAAGLAGLPVDFACEVPAFDPVEATGNRRAWRLDRYAQFAVAAAREAVADAGLGPAGWEAGRVGVVVGTAAGGVATFAEQQQRLQRNVRLVSPLTLPMFLPNMAAAQVAAALGARGPCLQTGAACASGAVAVASAVDLLRTGACDVVIAGAADAMVTPLCAAAFASLGALSRRRDAPATASRPFDADRDGFVLGEGAGILVLERPATAQARGATVYAHLAGYAATCDAYDIVAPDPEGRGLTAALREALDTLDRTGIPPSGVSYVNAHGTSTPLNDRVEAAVLARHLPADTLVSSTKGVTGHLMGAAGAVELALTALTIARGTVPPTANLTHLDPAVHLAVPTVAQDRPVAAALSVSMGFGGHNTVWALTR
ncbi:beta-ketoacyl-[acyl-carrier-protein] synthase family protein [Hamadaea tsunoensis]|uniref:beta-ketoacyl-[acyl-carrier-protein] synthase family protein n=1 Tax=Hamadaea tsunoensis TaxID=53368 RepID=UPI00041B2732|nr:beta-ketoacyl-[acyl-carrier-protein] synthase family protein [Hamadaea tsunoensis]